jgi:DNA-binding PadR family transcriptional regulator
MTSGPKDARSFLPLTSAVMHILLSLTDGKRHGYAISKEVAERTQGDVKLGPGTLYGTLGRMVDSGLVADAGGDDEGRRRFYEMTPMGRDVLALEARRLAEVVSAARAKAVI